MEQEFFSPVEKKIIFSILAKQGKEFVLNVINEQRHSGRQYDVERDIYFFQRTVFLQFEGLFNEDESEKNALRESIFKKIQEIEKNEGYYPEGRPMQRQDYTEYLRPTNYLGNGTRYYRVEEENDVTGELKAGICVTARLMQKEPLLQLVQNYKD